MAELDRLDRRYGLGAMPVPGERTRRRRSHGPLLPSLVVTGLLVAGVVALSPDDSMRSVRRLVGFGDHRLGTPPHVPVGRGSFEFLRTQPVGHDPVGYDPCRTIEVLVNPAGAPADYDELVDTAIQHTSAATGLKLERVGLTDARDTASAVVGLARRTPVLVMWADDREVPGLAGDVAGLGGSTAVATDTGRWRYVTGRVVLDQDVFARFTPDQQPLAQAIVDHEFGHLVGLAHVHDPGELMYDDNVGRTSYGPGDREGLARLGGIPC
jgi:hypothetical protein